MGFLHDTIQLLKKAVGDLDPQEERTRPLQISRIGLELFGLLQTTGVIFRSQRQYSEVSVSGFRSPCQWQRAAYSLNLAMVRLIALGSVPK
jgi:hypothetical protein